MGNQIKKCPYCAEEILYDAKKCKHCGEFLDTKVNNNEQLIYNHFSYTFILRKGRDNFIKNLEEKFKLEELKTSERNWSETYGGGSSLFDRHTINKVETVTHECYDVSFKIAKDNLKFDKGLIDLYYKFYNLTYDNSINKWIIIFYYIIFIYLGTFILALIGGGSPGIALFLRILCYYPFKKLVINSRKKSLENQEDEILGKIKNYKLI